MAAIGERVAQEAEVLVLSGTAGSAAAAAAGKPAVVEVGNWMPGKAALLKRALAELLFTIRMFVAMLTKLRRGDVALTAPAPFMLPYAFAAAAKLKGARSVLIMHDLSRRPHHGGPAEAAFVAGEGDARAERTDVSRADAVVIIGRDTEKLLLRYGGITSDKIRFIPNWATLERGVRAVTLIIRRRPLSARRRRLSGNLGLPTIRHRIRGGALLRDKDIHFLLSGWGWADQLKAMQAEAKLERHPGRPRRGRTVGGVSFRRGCLDHSYRRNVAGVSVPSRF
jgi:hypothetical protein